MSVLCTLWRSWSCCDAVDSGGSTLWRIRVVAEIVEELLVCFFQQLFECYQIWRIKAAMFATTQKCVYTLRICCRSEVVPCGRGIEYLRHNYRWEDGLETGGVQAVTA